MQSSPLQGRKKLQTSVPPHALFDVAFLTAWQRLSRQCEGPEAMDRAEKPIGIPAAMTFSVCRERGPSRARYFAGRWADEGTRAAPRGELADAPALLRRHGRGKCLSGGRAVMGSVRVHGEGPALVGWPGLPSR
jgi:hypothetical protein